jgi:chaperonin GroES
MMNLQPLNDNLIVRPLMQETQTASGIFIPDSGEKKPGQGEVIAVGPGSKKDDGTQVSMTVKVGDRILFRKYSPDEFEINGDKVLVLSEKDVLAIINN